MENIDNQIDKTFALINNSFVINLIVAESLEIAEEVTGFNCVEYYVPKIGDRYINNEFIPNKLDSV